MVSAIYLPAIFWIFARKFSLISQKKKILGVGYPLVWYLLRKENQLRVGKEWQIFIYLAEDPLSPEKLFLVCLVLK